MIAETESTIIFYNAPTKINFVKPHVTGSGWLIVNVVNNYYTLNMV